MSLALAIVIGSTVAAAGQGQDWPQWRGDDRDGEASGFQVPASWPSALNRGWRVEIGTGYATPLVVGDRVYVFSRQGDDEVMTALNAASGETLWRTRYPAPFEMNPATARHGPGPKSTPTFAGGRLFTLGMSGTVTAFEAETGTELWQHPGTRPQPMFHTAMSPIVDGNRVIFHVGGHNEGALTAYDVASGEVQWRWTGDGPAYSSPLIVELGGVRQVVTFTQNNLVGVSLDTGDLLWRRPFTTPSDTTAQTPILYGDTIIQTGRANGVTAFRVRRTGTDWTTEDVWHTDEVSVHMSDVVDADGLLFGLSHLNSGQYFGLDLETGEVLWRSEPRQAEHAAIAWTGDTILSLEDDGELVVIRRSRAGFEPMARYTVSDSATWGQAAFSGNRVFLRDVSTLSLWTVN